MRYVYFALIVVSRMVIANNLIFGCICVEAKNFSLICTQFPLYAGRFVSVLMMASRCGGPWVERLPLRMTGPKS